MVVAAGARNLFSADGKLDGNKWGKILEENLLEGARLVLELTFKQDNPKILARTITEWLK